MLDQYKTKSNLLEYFYYITSLLNSKLDRNLFIIFRDKTWMNGQYLTTMLSGLSIWGDWRLYSVRQQNIIVFMLHFKHFIQSACKH